MASNNMTKIMALYLTFNLVFLGIASAQPVAQPVCPLTPVQVQVCSRILSLTQVLTTRNAAPCCTLLSGLDVARASVCACNAATTININVLNLLGITVNLRALQLLNICGVASPAGFSCN